MLVPDDVQAFGVEVASCLDGLLGGALVGVYFVGSIALGGYVPGESDLDIVAVSLERIPEELKASFAEALLGVTPLCPARGVELTLYRQDVVRSPPAERAEFELNVNGGPRMPEAVHLDASEEPWFWYVLDRAIARRCGALITGPPPAELFADAPRLMLLEAMWTSMRWHREHEKATLYSVLNASRAWRFAEADVLGSKLDGAAWARRRWSRPEVIDAAAELRHGRHAYLDAGYVDELLRHVESVLRSSTGR